MSPWRAVAVATLMVAILVLLSGSSATAAVGAITEYAVPTVSSEPDGIAAGPDGNVWFTEYGANKLAKMTTSGAVTEYPSPTAGSGLAGIAAGPDGNLWVTELNANKLARVTTTGVFTEYTFPTAGSVPENVAVGVDGNLWVTEYGGNKVAKVTTSGMVVAEYAVPTPNSATYGIVAGPDGNLWFTEDAGNKVAKLTTSGVITEYPLPILDSRPRGITAGPDGNLWITEYIANKVAKMTPTGALTEYAVPTSGNPNAIAAGPDGNLWFTKVTGDKVGEITTAGVVTEYPIPSAGSQPWDVASGPDGNVWFTEFVGNNVAKVALDLDCAAGAGPVLKAASSALQYNLANSDGTTWQEISAPNLRVFCNPTASQSLLLTTNADLWTANAGFNQDLGIFVSDNGGADTLLAWKESGGFAGTFSPNAAYVHHLFNMTSGHTYIFKLKWKTNKPAAGATIFAGAGGGTFSPTSLLAEAFPTGTAPNFAVSTQQYTLASSNGASWQTIDASNLSTTLSPSANTTAVLGANADLWTANAGFNQDFGIFVSDNGGADALVAWKESGGFAGTFSPNAAFVKATYAMTAGHTYVFKLKWKTNKPAAGSSIVIGAGPIGGLFSPTSLLVNSIPAGANPYSAVSTSQYSLSNSDGATWQTIDAALNVTVAPGANTNAILGANADLWTANAGFNQDLGIFVSDNGGADVLVAWKESGGFAGTFSPNAAFAQAFYQMSSGHIYVFKLKWKTNKNAPGATIYAAAGGPVPFSPTRLTVELTS